MTPLDVMMFIGDWIASWWAFAWWGWWFVLLFLFAWAGLVSGIMVELGINPWAFPVVVVNDDDREDLK